MFRSTLVRVRGGRLASMMERMPAKVLSCIAVEYLCMQTQPQEKENTCELNKYNAVWRHFLIYILSISMKLREAQRILNLLFKSCVSVCIDI